MTRSTTDSASDGQRRPREDRGADLVGGGGGGGGSGALLGLARERHPRGSRAAGQRPRTSSRRRASRAAPLTRATPGASGARRARPARDPRESRLQHELLPHAHSAAGPADDGQDPLGRHRRRRREGHERPAAAGLDALGVEPSGQRPQPDHVEQRLHRRRRRAEAVGELGPHLRDRVVPAQVRQALVDREPLIHLGNVGVRQERLDAHRDDGIHRRPDRLALQFSHGLGQELGVKIEAHGRDVAVLLRPQQVAGAADLQVPHGEPEAGAELGHLLDHAQPPLRRLVDAGRRRAPAGTRRPAGAPARRGRAAGRAGPGRSGRRG